MLLVKQSLLDLLGAETYLGVSRSHLLNIRAVAMVLVR